MMQGNALVDFWVGEICARPTLWVTATQPGLAFLLLYLKHVHTYLTFKPFYKS